MSAPIHYSRGRENIDAYPEQRTAGSWEAFTAAVLNDQARSKGLQYIAAPFKPNGDGRAHRCQEGALESAFIGFDFDGFSSPMEFSETIQHLQRYKGFAYTTASHTTDAPRARAILSATREMDWAERKRVSLALQAELEKAVGAGCIKFDQSVYQAEQPMYCPPLGTRSYLFDGAPVAVDKVLETAPPLPDRKGKRERAEAIATDDPVLQALQEKEMVLQELEAGKFAIVCPFDQEHTSATSDSSTVYFLPHFAGVKYGKFHCLHDHCAHRDQPAFLQALGLDPGKVWAKQAGTGGSKEGNQPPQDGESGTGFDLVLIHDLGHGDVPAPEYIVDPILPTGVPTLLGAHGGTGKSFLALVLAACVATGRDFMGLPTQRVRVVFYSAEDGKKVIRWRLQKICRALNIDPGELSRWLVVLDVTDTDPALFREAQESGVRIGVLTAAFEALNRWACDTESRLVIIDNASDTYDANENERARVRAFMRGLARLARRIDGAVMLLAHVNRETAKIGKGTEGYSGSTAWHNSARSRLFLSEDNGGLLLEHQKSNLGPKAEPLALDWERGIIMRGQDAVGRQNAEALTEKADAAAVLCAIEAAHASGDNVPTGRTGPATTWHHLKTLPELPEPLRERSNKDRFWRALARLDRERKIQREPFRDSHRNERTKWVPCVDSEG